MYAAGGYYYPGQNHDKLKDEMRSYIDRGYTVVKKKIGGADLDEDLRRIDAVLSVLQDGQKLAVDANGRFDLDTAVKYAKALSQYDLFWYEEPGDPLDFELQATLRNYYKNPMATGEDLFSMQDARNLIRYGGMRADRDWLQFDCALSYGLVEYLRTLDMLKEHGWSPKRCIPHGGHQMSLNIAAGLGLGGNESYPDLFQPYGGFPDGVKVDNGHIVLPELPGIGFEGKADLYREMVKLIFWAVCASVQSPSGRRRRLCTVAPLRQVHRLATRRTIMSRILAGHFQLQDEVDAARAALLQAGFADSRISAFFVNQPGQHDLHELGGDRDMSPGAKETPEGIAEGAAVGAAVGAGVGAAAVRWPGRSVRWSGRWWAPMWARCTALTK